MKSNGFLGRENRFLAKQIRNSSNCERVGGLFFFQNSTWFLRKTPERCRISRAENFTRAIAFLHEVTLHIKQGCVITGTEWDLFRVWENGKRVGTASINPPFTNRQKKSIQEPSSPKTSLPRTFNGMPGAHSGCEAVRDDATFLERGARKLKNTQEHAESPSQSRTPALFRPKTRHVLRKSSASAWISKISGLLSSFNQLAFASERLYPSFSQISSIRSISRLRFRLLSRLRFTNRRMILKGALLTAASAAAAAAASSSGSVSLAYQNTLGGSKEVEQVVVFAATAGLAFTLYTLFAWL